MSKTLMDEKIDSMRDLLKVQCSTGNYDYDPYMHGMANGMILFLALIEGNDPEFMDAPAKWLVDNTEEHVLTCQE